MKKFRWLFLALIGFGFLACVGIESKVRSAQQDLSETIETLKQKADAKVEQGTRSGELEQLDAGKVALHLLEEAMTAEDPTDAYRLVAQAQNLLDDSERTLVAEP